MHTIDVEGGATVVRGRGVLSRAEVEEIAARAALERRASRRVVLDLTRVSHLHYRDAARLARVRGLRAAVTSQYVKALLHAGAGVDLEVFDDLADALATA